MRCNRRLSTNRKRNGGLRMSFALLGILQSQTLAAGGGEPAFDLLETTILGSDTASVSFTSLNSTYGSDYKHLQVRIVNRSGRSDTNDGVRVRMNTNDAAQEHSLEGNGSSVFSTSKSGNFDPIIVANNSPTGEFSATILDILDAFDTSKNTTMRALTGYSSYLQLTSGLYTSTSAVDELLFSNFGGNILTGSRFSLYGIKAA